MPSENPIESIAKGATEGILDWTSEKINELVTKFKEKDIAFIEDVETIEIAKKQRNKAEWKLFKRFVKDKDLRILFQMGLTLRELEDCKKDFEPLRGRIKNRYNFKGLHIAQIVQNGIFSKYIGNILDKASTDEELGFEILELFDKVEHNVIFIKAADNDKQKIREILTRIDANSPKTFIISSSGTANAICKKIHEKLMKELSGYVSESCSTENKEIYFLNRKED